MMDARAQLTKLRRIQDLLLDAQAARSVVESAPLRFEQIEGEFRDRNTEYVQFKERHDEIERDRAARSLELQDLEESRKKFMDSLMQVKNQREYAAVLKEIDTVKARIAENEDAVLKSMEELETLRGELASRAEHIEAERKIVEEERSKVDVEVAAAGARARQADAERAALEAELPRDLVATIRRIAEGRKGVFLARAERESCTACHVRIRPQVFQEIKSASKIHACSNCRRILYDEASLRPASSGRGTDAPVEAMNGGAV